jgi:hypothetical protein
MGQTIRRVRIPSLSATVLWVPLSTFRPRPLNQDANIFEFHLCELDK